VRKYRNKKTIFAGIIFDSFKEAQRFRELMLLQSIGQISELELQKEFELIPAQYETFPRYGKNGNRLKDGKRCIEKPVKYKADFVYKENGVEIVEDTKGVKTKDYIIKRKLMLYVHGKRIREV
jgi:hypothetical protein